MFRWLITGASCLVLLAGCSDTRQPVRRERSLEPQARAPNSPMTTAPGGMMPHGLSPANVGGPEVDLGTVRLTAPESWVRKPPRISFIILAEFALPRAEGDPDDGRLTVSTASGSIEENVKRWQQQFTGASDQKPPEEVEIAGIQVTMVDLAGTFRDQHGRFAPAEEHPGYQMLGAIIPIDGQLHFIKATGPKKTIAAHADEFQAFVRSLEPVKATE